MNTRLLRHGAPLALGIITIAAIALRGGPPPSVPCDGRWIWKAFGETEGCNQVDSRGHWVCQAGGADADSLPLSFEPNAGQAPGKYDYVSHTRSLAVALEKGDADLVVQGPDGASATVRLHLDGAVRGGGAVGEQPLPGVANYFIGRDPSQWRTNIPSFARVRYRDVYPGIDVAYYGTEGELEHDFIVKPGADPANIRMELVGADTIRVEGDGSVSAVVKGLSVTWRKPVLYQMRAGRRQPVSGSYRATGGNGLAFEVGGYDRSSELVIDPVITYASYHGRSNPDTAGKVVVDSAGNAYTAGMTFDINFPVTPGAVYVRGNQHGDILLTKFNPTGTAVLYSTHIGGENAEGATGLAIDSAGNLYIATGTDSDDYPLTRGALKPALQSSGTPEDPFDCAVTKLNAAGNTILYSTYLGGPENDTCMGIAVDQQGNAYVTGRTNSYRFSVSDDAFQRIPRGGADGFVAKINPQGTGLVYSTLFGGTRDDAGMAIAVDAQGHAYVAGYTTSSFGFPITRDVLQPTWGGTRSLAGPGDAFVMKVNPTGTGLIYSTYLGGSLDDNALGIAIDAQGNAYVTGNTVSANFKTTEGAFQREMKGDGGNDFYRAGDAFVAKVNPTATALVYSTLIGGSLADVATGIAVDASGNAYIAGTTLSADFPVSQDAHQKTFGGSSLTQRFPTGDAFVTQLNAAGSALVYSTYLGGSADELGLGVAVDATGAIYAAGSTFSTNFPVTPGAPQPYYAGSIRQVAPFGDAFLVRFGNPVVEVPLPAIRTFGSAANNAAVAVAPGEWIVIAGTNLGPAARVEASARPLPTVLAGTRVLFDEVAAPIFHASASAVQVAAPFAVSGRATTQMVVETNGRRSLPLTIPVVATKPALFSVNGEGNGQGAIVNLVEGTVNRADAPINPGGWVGLTFTGGGQTSPPGEDGRLVPDGGASLLAPVTVTVAGRAANVSYAGGAMGQVAGLARVDFMIPEGTEAGDQEVIVTVGSVRSQGRVTVAVRPLPALESDVQRRR